MDDIKRLELLSFHGQWTKLATTREMIIFMIKSQIHTYKKLIDFLSNVTRQLHIRFLLWHEIIKRKTIDGNEWKREFAVTYFVCNIFRFKLFVANLISPFNSYNSAGGISLTMIIVLSNTNI